MRSPDELTALFRASGRKATPQRVGIFRALHGVEEHPTAEAVHATVSAEMPSISLRTVYQTLHELAEMGQVQQLDLGTGSARFDPNVDVHHHLVCDVCGKVRDLYATFADVRVPVGGELGFDVASTEIVFRGRCHDCTPDNNPPVQESTDSHG